MDLHQLFPLVGIVVVVFVLVSIIGRFKKAGRADYPYERIEKLFSPAERSFLGVLEENFGRDYAILGKLRLADIIRVRKGLSNSARTAALNRITSKHVDFALCDLDTREVIGVIELDDSSHQKASRQRRDEFIDKALGAAGVPAVHITAQRSYTPAKVREQVSILLGARDINCARSSSESS